MEKGLTQQETQILLKKYGKNRIETHSTTSALKIFLSQFPTVINAILVVAAVFSYLIGHALDGSFILAIIFLNSLFGFIQEYRAEKSLEKLKNYAAPTARVLRDGKESQINAEDLVPDDIVILSEGARVPADGVIIDANNLEIDEAILTGESLPVIKNNNDATFLGTLVTRGNGMLKITQTGMATRFGEITKTLGTITDEKTPLQKDFTHLGKVLSLAALLIALLVIPIGIYHKQDLIPLILVAISIGVAAIPEGLPTVITIAFAVGSSRLAKKNAIVRKMAAIETLGAIQVVLVDKTGTITQNSMQVKHDWLKNKESLHQMLRACVLGNTASLVEKENGQYEIVGDSTDGALLLWATKHEHFPHIPEGKVLDEYVFDTNTQTITTLWQQDGHEYVFVRGAPEAILDRCTITEAERETVTKQYEAFAKQGLRTIGFAIKKNHHFEQKKREHLESNLTFIGILALYDPPRPEIKEAINKARTAGIHVCMVTGDNDLTALALSKEVGLIEKDEEVITGETLEKMSDAELSDIILKTRVFARTRPEQKLRIATLLQKQGIVVGVTGDGVNDALALKKADVGVAMGKKGTDVAKEASDIILADDNFATLVHAIEEGRVIYKNIANAILYLLSGNLAEISIVLVASVLNLPFPLVPTQILWINLVTDSLPALALATGSRDGKVLLNKPRDPNTRLLSKNRILTICLIGFSLTAFLISLFAFTLQTQSLIIARTLIFNGLIYAHLVIAIGFGWHSIKKGHPFLIFTILIIAVLQIIITFVPFFQNIFHLAV
ncbi:cation-translocating P-type ATPase [Candidatus Gottesmanbacteria bacterium]|nr:cation-translocating P-type ATPase [Candidatus Gottesmanbacteria bacterium]